MRLLSGNPEVREITYWNGGSSPYKSIHAWFALTVSTDCDNHTEILSENNSQALREIAPRLSGLGLPYSTGEAFVRMLAGEVVIVPIVEQIVGGLVVRQTYKLPRGAGRG
jgi:hypothetical protein